MKLIRICSFLSSIILLAIFGALSQSVAEDSVINFKNQKHSLVDWGEVNLNKFLSFKYWKDDQDEKARVPEWETIIKERNNHELVGHFFQCVGKCRIDRGPSFFNPNYKTSIYEGDEIQTIGESFAWIFLMDGTMVRLSPESSIIINEMNIGTNENFINAKVNTGNIVWLSRNSNLYEELNIRETDVLFNPLVMYEAQPTSDIKKYKEDDLIELVSEKETILNQYKYLNELISKNNLLINGKPTYAYIVMPNCTIMGQSPNIEVVSLMSGKTFFKKRSLKFIGQTVDDSTKKEEETLVQLRGFENKELKPIESDKWFEVDQKGKTMIEGEENIYWLTMGEFITKRIPSLLVARELLIKKYSEIFFLKTYNRVELARDYGYRLWGSLKNEDSKKSDLAQRIDFLNEYNRRVETTNLLMTSHLSEKLKDRHETLKSMEYGNYFFIKALDKYYSYEEYNNDSEDGEIKNSTTKLIWKRMHGIK